MSENVLEWKDLFYEKLNSDKNLNCKFARTVDGLSGKAISGQLTAIMGSSGAGKTNLFELLVGKIESSSKTSGEVLFNGKQRKLEDWIKKISYLEQGDIYFPELTIYESMFYSLQLLYSDIKKDVIDSMIEKALRRAEIYDKKNALINSLSGGERKRAMIALKLIGEPEILILDEPTTGLDSHNALCIVNNLKKEAEEKNIIVIMTVNQPGEALFNLFDKLIYITRKGVLYEGPVEKVEEFLNSYGIIKMDKISTSEFLFELFSKNPYPYEIKDLQPRAEEIVSKNREKNSEARFNLDLKSANNSYINLNEVRFDHMCTLIRRKVYLITRNPYVFLWFVFFCLISAFGIWMNRILYYDRLVPQLQLNQNPNYFSELSFLESFTTVFHSMNSIGNVCFMWVLIFSFKLSFNSSVCKQEIFTGKYSVSTYFVSMILFELGSFFLLSLFFVIPQMYLFCDVKSILSILIISTGYILVSYFSFLPVFSYFTSNFKLYPTIYLLYSISGVEPVLLKALSIYAAAHLWKGLKYVFYLFNILPFFLFNILTKYSFSKLFERFNRDGFYVPFYDPSKHIPAEEFLKSCDFLGYVFSPTCASIWGIVLLTSFTYISFIFIKWRISSNIRLEFN